MPYEFEANQRGDSGGFIHRQRMSDARFRYVPERPIGFNGGIGLALERGPGQAVPERRGGEAG